MQTFRRLTTRDELDVALASTDPILIFKHSPTCGISAQAHGEIAALLDGPPLAAAVDCVLVREGRAVSNAIAERCGVSHESPQVIRVDRGVARWHAWHFRVGADAIQTALHQYGLTTQA